MVLCAETWMLTPCDVTETPDTVIPMGRCGMAIAWLPSCPALTETDVGPLTETVPVVDSGPSLTFTALGPPEGSAENVAPGIPNAWSSSENETSPVPVMVSIVALL